MPTLLLALASLLCAPQQPDPAPDAAPASASPFLAIELLRPEALAAALQHGPLAERLLALPAVEERLASPQGAIAKAVSGMLLGPVQGEWSAFAEAFAGDGLLVTLGGEEPQFAWLLWARGTDGDLAQSCLMPVLGFAGVQARDLGGESWSVAVGELQLARRGDHFLAGPKGAALPDDPSAAPLPAGYAEARASAEGSSLFAVLAGAALRADGYPDLPEDLGASLLAGEWHEALRVAPWLAVTMDLDRKSLRLGADAPIAPELRQSHAAFLPTEAELLRPVVDERLVAGSMSRDLGRWWTARDRFASEAAVADSVETDGNFALLFGRDPGSEVFAQLEPHQQFVAGRLPAEEAQGLALELPGAAFGLRLRDDAPRDLGSGFVNAFLAAVTFSNFEGGALGDQSFLLDVKALPGGKLYYGALRRPADAVGLPVRANLSPALWVGEDGEIWLATSAGFLEHLLRAPRERSAAHGLQLSLHAGAALALLQRNREALIAQRALQEGGDLEAAASFIASIEAGLAQADALHFVSAAVGSQLRARLTLEFAASAAPAATKGSDGD